MISLSPIGRQATMLYIQFAEVTEAKIVLKGHIPSADV